MIDIQQIIGFDKQVLLALNGSDSIFWDNFMWTYTGRLIWVPLAASLLYVIIKNNKWKEALLIVCMVGLVILLADRISSGFFKPFFHRFRPTHDPEIMGLVDVVNGYRSGKYGFLSGHAANSFGVITFVSLLIRRKGFTFALIIWAALNCYSRIYLGVHFPGDILCGTVLGCLIGVLVYYLYRFLNKKIFSREYSHVIAHQNNKYTISDVKPILTVLYLSYFFIIVKALL